MPGLSADELESLQITTKVTAGLGIIGSIAVISHFLFSKNTTSLQSRIITFMALGDFCTGISKFIGRYAFIFL